MERPRPVCLAIAVGLLLCDCGSRSQLYETQQKEDGGGSADDAAPTEAAAPDVSSPEASAEASACTAAPTGGVAVGSFSTSVISLGIAVAGNTVYAGTSAIDSASPLYVGAVSRVPADGGPTQPLSAPEFTFGSIATDGARLYYPQSSGRSTGNGGAIYQVLGLASVDLATGAVHPISTSTPPRSTSSNLNSTMMAATAAHPGVFWIGSPSGADGASTLAAWDPQSDAVTVIATGQDLSGLAVDSTQVYWADAGGNQGITVYSRPLGGGSPVTLATVPGGSHATLLGVSSADVLFVSDYATGSIEVVSKSGGPVRHLVTASSAWVNAYGWVDDSYFYWSENNAPWTLERIAVASGSMQVVPIQGQAQSLAFDTCNVYIGTIHPTQVVIQPKT